MCEDQRERCLQGGVVGRRGAQEKRVKEKGRWRDGSLRGGARRRGATSREGRDGWRVVTI